MKKFISLLLIMMLLLTACQKEQEEEAAKDEKIEYGQKTEDSQTQVEDPHFVEKEEELFTERDQEDTVDETGAVTVQFSGKTATASHSAAKVTGTTVTLTQEATYILSGSWEEGSVIVDAPDDAKVQIVLKGASVTSAASAPLAVVNADKVFINLAEGTENALINGGTLPESYNAALYSKQDLTISGSGNLSVTSPAGHGITCKDTLAITGGAISVTSSSHGLDANDSIRISGGTFGLAAGKDGIHAENNDDATLGFVYISGGTFDIDAEGDGISAGNSLQIEGGTFDIVCGGGSENAEKETSDHWGAMGGGMGGPGGMERPGGGMGGKPGYRTTSTATVAETEDTSTSMKGLKAGSEMKLSGGTFTMDCADDAVHSNGDLLVEGGTFTIATGDDGFHGDNTLTFTAGTVNITESYEGLEGLYIAVKGGDLKMVCTDDGLNAAGGTDNSGTEGGRDGMFGGMGGPGGGMSAGNGSIAIEGGTLYINSSGDGLDANGTLTISGGHTTVVGPTQGDTATLDYDRSATITGGTFIGTGASGMAQTFSNSEQGVIAVSVGNQAAGTKILLADEAGKELISYAPELDFAVVIFSSPDIQKGATYTITVGDSNGTTQAS